MTLGLDFYGTISSYLKRFRELAQEVLDGGGKVYIVSAVHPENEQRLLLDIKRSRMPYTAVAVIPYERYQRVPKLKLEKCRELRIDVMIDDRQDTCALLAKRGYTALFVTPKG